MGDFAVWLQAARTPPANAFEAHRRLVEIHPFNDGNGRNARLLMNLILARAGFPPTSPSARRIGSNTSVPCRNPKTEKGRSSLRRLYCTVGWTHDSG